MRSNKSTNEDKINGYYYYYYYYYHILLLLIGGKDITPAKFQLDQFITVGGVDGQKHTHTYTDLT